MGQPSWWPGLPEASLIVPDFTISAYGSSLSRFLPHSHSFAFYLMASPMQDAMQEINREKNKR